MAICRGFLVANFANHDLVWVVAENRAQTAGEGQTFFFVDGNLGDAAKLVLDGIFDGDDFVFVGLISFTAAYRVVVLPEPVGPVTSTMP